MVFKNIPKNETGKKLNVGPSLVHLKPFAYFRIVCFTLCKKKLWLEVLSICHIDMSRNNI